MAVGQKLLGSGDRPGSVIENGNAASSAVKCANDRAPDEAGTANDQDLLHRALGGD
jgi:hypothetical protein